ncbi:MAG: transglycosylase domain-containing protein, partial [Alicyclobacillus sp.]|nr:transglycosylase domain-containing protein [Alicyclobacillus sp.]
MNWVYMGKIGDQPVYGVKTASELIFHKDPKDLNLPEAALLAAIPNNPTLFSPYDNFNNALQRQHYILNQMLTNQLITQSEYDAAMHYDIRKDIQPAPKTTTLLQHPYLMLDDIRPLLVKYLVDSGRYATADDALKALPTAGYKVYTSIDLNAQQQMEQVLADNSLFGHTDKPALGANGKPLLVDGKPVMDLYEAGMTLIDNETGGILALGGGRDYQRDSIDHSDVPQQPGSAIKPLLDYGPALDMHQMTAATPIFDAPVHFAGSNGTVWSPMDDDDQWHGIVTVRQALVESLNVPAIKVLEQIGPAKAGAYLAKLGITTQARTLNGQPTLDPSDLQHLSTAIGGMRWGLTVQQMTSAYTVFPNQGIYRPAYLIARIVDRDGNTVYQYKPTATKVFSPQTAFIMTDILHDVVYRPDGTAYSGVGTHFPGDYIAGKTGTTDDHRDGWFIGYTQKYTLGIWMGYNHNQQIDTGPGVNWYNLKFSLWNRVMEPLLKANPPTKPFPEPPGVVRLDVCSKSGQLPTSLCADDHDVISEWFIQGTEPTTPCTVHVQALYTVVNGKRYLATTETPAYAIRTGIFLVPPGKLDPGVMTPDSGEYLPTQPDPRGGEVLTGAAPEQVPAAPALAAPAEVHAELSS